MRKLVKIIKSKPEQIKIPPNKIGTPKDNKKSSKMSVVNNTSRVGKLFDGGVVFIIGGGPSLSGFDWSLLSSKNVIAVNKAFQFVDSDVIFWTDSRFYDWYKSDIDKTKSVKYTINKNANYTKDVNLIQKGVRYGLETDNSKIAHGDNSGYAAINLAYHLGAKTIILLGYDMSPSGGKSHFHSGYPTKETPIDVYRNRFLVAFPHLIEPLKSNGVKVYNATKNTHLHCFDKITVEQALCL